MRVNLNFKKKKKKRRRGKNCRTFSQNPRTRGKRRRQHHHHHHCGIKYWINAALYHDLFSYYLLCNTPPSMYPPNESIVECDTWGGGFFLACDDFGKMFGHYSRKEGRKHRALRPQKPLRLIRDGEVGGSGISYLTPTLYAA